MLVFSLLFFFLVKCQIDYLFYEFPSTSRERRGEESEDLGVVNSASCDEVEVTKLKHS